jgi:SDR family mycofactocin-dependent oxidoreductase
VTRGSAFGVGHLTPLRLAEQRRRNVRSQRREHCSGARTSTAEHSDGRKVGTSAVHSFNAFVKSAAPAAPGAEEMPKGNGSSVRIHDLSGASNSCCHAKTTARKAALNDLLGPAWVEMPGTINDLGQGLPKVGPPRASLPVHRHDARSASALRPHPSQRRHPICSKIFAHTNQYWRRLAECDLIGTDQFLSDTHLGSPLGGRASETKGSHMARLDDRVALVTGAARGQGRAHALRLARDGADVMLFDACVPFDSVDYDGSTVAELEETGKLVEAEGRRAFVRRVDARSLPAVTAFVADGIRELGRLDVVVVNHGICAYGYTWELTEAAWEEMISVNLTSVWKVLRAVAPPMVAQGSGGSIIITSSVAGLRGLPFLAHYVASKHGVVGLAKTLANELAQYNIRVNTVHPAPVKTVMGHGEFNSGKNHGKPFNGELDKPDVAATLGPIFMNALPHTHIDPEDVAAAVAFLAGDEARFITGAQVPIDLGTLNR